ncbi:MAG TPA: DUF1684 domain-containing protein, partial [Candidatus Polarisedimenticolia bacterium]|nr:DUF1684 domain-containing protein [Candidatus Polarisedimenticolia bacterium]
MKESEEMMGLDAVALALALLPAGTDAAAAKEPIPYEREIAQWREAREARLKADGGWLTVAGLFWLKEGENKFGTDPAGDIVLPAGSAAASAGVLELRERHTKIRIAPGVVATVDGKPITSLELRADSSGTPDVVTMGALTMHVIERGGRFGIRLKDMNSSLRKEFTGLKWFPVKESYRVVAKFIPRVPAAELQIPNVLGMVEKMPSPGTAVFKIGDQEIRLDPVLEDPNAEELFYIFRDSTSGHGTYPAGRFLYSAMPKDGQVVLDFNKAYNPPCAFTPYATCP